jgi:hypothetical protein
MSGVCLEPEYMKLLEELIRGISLHEPSKTTELFAKMYKKKLRETGCLGAEDKLVMSKFAEAFEND